MNQTTPLLGDAPHMTRNGEYPMTDASGTPSPNMEIVEVSPELAAKWLDKNNHNRNLRASVVNKYARAMGKGHWTFNGEPIQFDWNGWLINGQHRLNAIVQSRTTQHMLVITNLPPSAHETLDGGAVRKPGDVLTLSGYRDGKTLATAARMALQMDLSPNVAKDTRNWSTAEIKARADNDSALVAAVEEVVPTLPKALFSLASRAVIGYAYYRLAQLNPTAAHTFFVKLGTLANLDADSPILALHRRLNAHAQGARTPQYSYETLAYIFMAWNAYRKGEGRTIIKLSHENGRVRLVTPV